MGDTLINLAGIKDCDKFINNELTRCGIPVVKCEKNIGEVAYTIKGQLWNFEFIRAWSYWMVSGKVPIDIAWELYNDPIGKTDIRVGGDCGCPAPEPNYVRWYSKKDGLPIYRMSDKDRYFTLKTSHPDWFKDPDPYFLDNPKECGVGFIESYHIDTELGLYIFSTRIKIYLNI